MAASAADVSEQPAEPLDLPPGVGRWPYRGRVGTHRDLAAELGRRHPG